MDQFIPDDAACYADVSSFPFHLTENQITETSVGFDIFSHDTAEY